MISAILLAAGQSKRMLGENKLIKKIHNIPLIKHSVQNILASSIDELIIVVGYQKEIIKDTIDKDDKIKFVFNEDYKSGIGSSIKMGIKNLSEKTEFFFICLGDMPNIKKQTYNKIIEVKNNKEIIVPTYKGKRGNPILFSKKMKNELMLIKGDVGAKKILELNKEKIFTVPIEDDGIIIDYDTKLDLK